MRSDSDDPDATRLRSGNQDVTRARAAPTQNPAADPTRLRPTPVGLSREPSTRPDPSDTLLRPTPVPPAKPLSPRPPDPSPVPHAGMVLQGHYQLDRLIGQGAMGQVWRARDLLSEEAGQRDAAVAIKLFVADFARNPNALALMQRETSRAQKLAHPNIVTVHQFDRDERTGVLFMVMELVDGRPLDLLLRESLNGLGREEGVPLIQGVADAVSYAHSQGIVHCDLKPGNILVNRSGVAKILDFGIAQAVQLADTETAAAAAAKTTPPQDELLSGYTPTYASLEALTGNGLAHPADDVFALGLVAYEIISGKHPFRRESAQVAKARNLKPARLPQLKSSQWRAVCRALELERARRWQNAAQFRKAFAGTSRLQHTLIAATVVLVLATAGFAYRSYIASGPAVAFDELPPATRTDILQSLKGGNEALDYVRRTHDFGPLDDAAVAFDHAYALHPRDRDAVKGLDATAKLAIEWADGRRDTFQTLDEIKKLTAITTESHYYEHNAALEAEIGKLSR